MSRWSLLQGGAHRAAALPHRAGSQRHPGEQPTIRRRGRRAFALGVLVLSLAAAGCGEGNTVQAGTDGGTGGAPGSVPEPVLPTEGDLEDELPVDGRTFEEVCGDAPEGTYCGVTESELHEMNMRYAERVDFSGDPTEAATVVGVVRERLAPFVGTAANPTEDEVRQALDGLESVQTSTNAVGASGTAFAVAVPGGCVFGSVSQGEVTVEIGGFINDGGCLASYGH